MNKKDKQINIRLTKKDKEKINYLSAEYGFNNVSDYIIKSSLGTLEKKNNNKKIVTLSLNPAVDYIVRTNNNLTTMTLFSPQEKYFEPGGKGINASIIIDQFNKRTLAIHHSGGFTGDLIKQYLNQMNIQQLQIKSNDTTRINMKLNFKERSYEINSLASPLSSIAKNKIMKYISSLEDGQTLMIMGSYHDDDEKLIYDISKICFEKNITLAFDISKSFLLNLLKFRPIIVKPNKEELEEIMGVKIKTDKELISSMKFLQKKGAKNVAVTLGKNGSFFLSESKDIYRATIKPIHLASPQGSGDSFISTYIVKKNLGDIEAFKWSNAAGVATAQVHGLADYGLIEANLDLVKIKKLN